MNTNNIVHTLFQSSKCNFVTDENSSLVLCDRNISEGDVLLIEHCLCQRTEDNSLIANALRFQEHLFNNLYPRTIPWSELFATELPSEDIGDLIESKISNNCFGDTNDITIANNIHHFNHTNRPNAYMSRKDVPMNGLPINCTFLSIIAMTDIKPGEEIVLRCGDGNLNAIAFKLALSPKGDNNKDIIDPYVMTTDIYKSHLEKIRPITEKYMKTPVFKIIYRNQVANTCGLFTTNNVIMPSQNFINTMANMYNRFECKTFEPGSSPAGYNIDMTKINDPRIMCEKWLVDTYKIIAKNID